MVQWVHEGAKAAKRVGRVIIATDDHRIQEAAQAFGAECIMTDPGLPSGTDRVAAIARMVPGEIFLSVQGDEPLMEPDVIDRAVEMVEDGGFDVGTAATPLRNLDELVSPSVVKALVAKDGGAIYFSRFPIPYSRISPQDAVSAGPLVPLRHLGIYAYRRPVLEKLASLAPTALEKGESLEQLRALENGLRIGVARVDSRSVGVDTPEDLEKVRSLLVRSSKAGRG
jgi:3-deoxy-manno-octulosonate cytidylyltransferase (CMP-KDO synthetase)